MGTASVLAMACPAALLSRLNGPLAPMHRLGLMCVMRQCLLNAAAACPSGLASRLTLRWLLPSNQLTCPPALPRHFWHAVDHEEGGLRVFESGAVLQYVCDCKCPPGSAAAAMAAQLLPPASEPRRRGPVLAWLSWMTVRGQLLGWQRAPGSAFYQLVLQLSRACAAGGFGSHQHGNHA